MKALSKVGYRPDHQNGSHVILRQNVQPFRRLTVPMHKELARGTLRAIIREAGLTTEQFIKIL